MAPKILASEVKVVMLFSSHADCPNVLSGLPPELLVYVFTFAASTSLKSARALSSVSAWTHNIVKPYLFDTITFDCSNIFTEFCRPVIQSRTIGQLARIRCAWIIQSCSRYECTLDTVLSLKNLVSLALGGKVLLFFISYMAVFWECIPKPPRDLRLLALDHLPRFQLCELSNMENALNMVTQLRFLKPDYINLDYLTLFPRLTRYATPFMIGVGQLPTGRSLFNVFEDALSHLPSTLQLLVLVFYTETYLRSADFIQWMTDIRKRDQRVALVVVDLSSVYEEWKEEEEEGGESLWEKAVRQTEQWL